MRILRMFTIIAILTSMIQARPSWCRNAKKNVEKRICASSRLAELEKEITKIYKIARHSASGKKRKRLIHAQRKWIKSRNNNCRHKSNTCIENYYTTRIEELRHKKRLYNLPSWCRNAKKNVEKRICRSQKLINLEKNLSELYKNKKSEAYGAEKQQLIHKQRQWIKDRNINCKYSKNTCIEKYYTSQIEALSIKKYPARFSNLSNLIKYNQKISEYSKSNSSQNTLVTRVNEKHHSLINIYIETKKKVITYSKDDSTIKIWDKNTSRLLKTFGSMSNVEKIYSHNNNIFFWNMFTLNQINLDSLKREEILGGKRPIGDMAFIGEYIIMGLNTEFGPVYNGVDYTLIDYKTHDIKVRRIYDCPWTRCQFDSFVLNFAQEKFYLKANNKYIEIASNDSYNPKSISRSEFARSSILKSEAFIYEINSEIDSDKYFAHSKNTRTMNTNNTQLSIHTEAVNEVENTCIVYNGKKIHCGVANGGSGAYDSQFESSTYTTNKGVMIVPGFIGTTVGAGDSYFETAGHEKSGVYFYAIDKDGHLLRRIERKLSLMVSSGAINVDTLHIYENKNYIVHEHKIEVLDDFFKTQFVVHNTISNQVIHIKRSEEYMRIFYSNGAEQAYNTRGLYLWTKYSLANNTEITLTPEGFFSGKGNFKEYIHFVDNKYNVYLINQFYDHFFRPDLVKLKLSGDEEAYQKAIKGMSYQEALKNPPPKLSFKSVDDKKAQLDGFEYRGVDTTKERVQLTFSVKQSGNGGIGLVRIYQEGKLIQTIGEGKVNKQSANLYTTLEQERLDSKAKEAQKEYLAMLSKAIDRNVTLNVEDTIAENKINTTQNKEGDYTIELELKSGSNDISIEAFNKTNTVTSYREHITINANIPKHKPKLYAIVVGVNEFEAPSVNNLKYSQNDANAIKELLEQKAKSIYADVEVKYLIGKDVTKANILKSAKEIAQKAKLNDTVLFFISTHGRAAKGKLYLVPQNNKLVSNWIDFEQTFKAIQSIKALKQIFIVDACESGKANDIVSSVYDSRASVLAKSSGVHMLLATTRGTSAFESNDPNIKNSLFTNRILTALKNNKTDLNKDNFISVIELSKELKNSQNSSEYQYPVIRNVGNDVVLERVE